MTVRANKPAFNVREKLKELERPIGVKGNELMRAETAQDARDLVSAGRKNLIINGDFRISQRGTSFTTTGDYCLDRWFCNENTDGSMTITQESSGGPENFSHYIQLNINTADTSIVSTQYAMIAENIEGYMMQPLGWGTPSAREATLSFYHKHTISGTYCIVLRDTDASYNYLIEYNQNIADTWEKTNVVIKPPPSGTWNTTNGIGLRLGFTAANGPSYQSSTKESWFSGQYYHSTPNQTNIFQTQNAKFRIAGVQLEVGKVATEFDHRPYVEELALCQRYYETNYIPGQVIGGTATWEGSDRLIIANIDGYTITTKFAVTKRSQPTVTIYSPQTGTSGTYHYTANTNPSATVINQSIYGFALDTSNAAGESVIVKYTASSEL